MNNPFGGYNRGRRGEPKVSAADVFWGLASSLIARTFTDRAGYSGDSPGVLELAARTDWRSGMGDRRPPWEGADFRLGDYDLPPGARDGAPSWAQRNGGRDRRGLRWNGRVAAYADGEVDLVATAFTHLAEEHGAPGGWRGPRRPGVDRRVGLIGSEREGVAPGMGWVRSLSVARGLALDAEGQTLSLDQLKRGVPKMKTMMTPISVHGMRAATHPDLRRSPIALNLHEVAPALMTWRDGVCQMARTDGPLRWGKTEFEQSLEREVIASSAGRGMRFWRDAGPGQATARYWRDLLDEGCRNVAVPAVPELIDHCDVQSTLHEERAYAAEVEKRRRGHAEMASSWRCLAAYLAARLDAVGRHMSPALMFARD